MLLLSLLNKGQGLPRWLFLLEQLFPNCCVTPAAPTTSTWQLHFKERLIPLFLIYSQPSIPLHPEDRAAAVAGKAWVGAVFGGGAKVPPLPAPITVYKVRALLWGCPLPAPSCTFCRDSPSGPRSHLPLALPTCSLFFQ